MPTTSERRPWWKARTVERKYERSLRGVAAEIARIFGGFPNPAEQPEALRPILQHLHRYAETITEWSQSVATRMVAESDAQDLNAWRAHTSDMGRALRREIIHAPTGIAARGLIQANVGLIKSLPLEAASRAQTLAIRALSDGTRADETAKMIAASGEVSKARAITIARTETSRAANTLTQARAEYIGSTSYIWRTAHDSDVRPSHAKMEGRTVLWSDPPTLDGMTAHAGCFPNCRCYSEPVIPEFK